MSCVGHVPALIAIEQLEDPDISLVACIKMYINKTKSLRTNKALFITLQKPHKIAQKVTLASWIRSVIFMSGQSGTGGSSRSAASSRAIGRGADLQAVMAAGDWASESTFRQF